MEVLQKIIKYILTIAAIIAGLLLAWYFRTIVLYIIVAAVLGIIGRPLVNMLLKVRFKDFSMPHWLAALLTLLLMWGVAVTFFSVFFPIIFNKLSALLDMDMTSLVGSFQQPIGRFEEFLHDYFAVDTDSFSITGALADKIRDWLDLGKIEKLLGSVISTVASTVVALFSVTFITFFFLKDDKMFLRILLAITPTRYEENIKHALGSATHLLSRYLRGILVESAVVMLIVSIGLMIWGFSAADAFFMGIIVGVLNVIPYVGPWLGFGICMLIGVAFVPPGMTLFTVFLAIGSSVLVAQGTDNFILQPVLYSNSVNAHPLEIFIVLLMAGKIGGVVGMIVAIPTYTVLRVIAKEFFYNLKLVRKLTENMDPDSTPRKGRRRGGGKPGGGGMQGGPRAPRTTPASGTASAGTAIKAERAAPGASASGRTASAPASPKVQPSSAKPRRTAPETPASTSDKAPIAVRRGDSRRDARQERNSDRRDEGQKPPGFPKPPTSGS